MSWLRQARNFKGLSAQQLADDVGVSLNYIQRIEGGSRPFTGEIRRRICEELGFGPKDISFDSKRLLDELDELARKEDESAFCSVSYIRVCGRLYYTGISELDPIGFSIDGRNDDTNPVRIRHARDLIEMQMVLYEETRWR